MSEPIRVLVIGANGQLGSELQKTVPANVALTATTRADIDMGDAHSIRDGLDRVDPQIVINATAYTAVDKAESEQVQADSVNHLGPRALAGECAARGLRLLHVSTDFVFSGDAGKPYAIDAQTGPLGVYGATKLAGEQAVLSSGADVIVLRTGWVYSSTGGNFVKTMLRLMADREVLTVVEDQIGTPTWAKGLAECAWDLALNSDAYGIHHWSDAGACSWYDFAVAIKDLGLELGLLSRNLEVKPIPASDYPTPAKRPGFSVLDKSQTRAVRGTFGVHWRDQLAAMLAEYKALS